MCWSLAASAQSYKIGDVYTAPDGSRGIVYYLHPDGSGGWVVALNDASTGCTWGASNDVPGLANQNPSYNQQLLNDTAGYANTQTLRNYQNNSTTYAAGKVDFSHGWVLPSPAQLSMLYGQLPFIASAITGAGGTALGYNQYWCSAENSASYAWCVDFGTNYNSGYLTRVAKTTSCRVRAVRSFSNMAVVYDTSLTYQWNTGSTQPYINVSPSQTTTYTVTGTTEYGCSNTAEQTIIVGTGSSQTIYDTVCQGAGYEANGFTLTEAETGAAGTLVRSRTLTTAGCSSTLTLRLRVNEPVVTTFSATACGSYTWNGVTYYESGDYTQTFTAANGCDSVVTMTLTINPSTAETLYASVLESNFPYMLNGSAYSSAGTYTQTLANARGCDSVLTLVLTSIPLEELPDNIDSADCTFLPEGTEWGIGEPIVSAMIASMSASVPLVGDIDDDGRQEIVMHTDSKILIFNSNAELKNQFNMCNTRQESQLALAKVLYAQDEYKTIIVAYSSNNYFYAYDASGQLLWQSNQPFSSYNSESYKMPAISFADFNNDGWTEMFAGSEIYDAATGVFLCKTNDNKGHAGRTWESYGTYQSSAADLLGDASLELAVGNTVYVVDLQSRSDASLNQISPLKTISSANMVMEEGSVIPFTDGNTFLLDINLDGQLDVLVMNVDQSNRVVYLYVWDVASQSIICSKRIDNARKFGMPQIGDLNNDGFPEICFIVGTYDNHQPGNNETIYALKYNSQTQAEEMDVLWTTSHSDFSGATSLTLFDFNQDGYSELVYRDENHLRIINGSMHDHQTGMAVTSPYDLAVYACGSGTALEYPIVCDVDLDGAAEIIIGSSCASSSHYGHLYIFKSSGEPWAPARKVWNQYMYNVTNVNEDLTIPQYLFNNATAFTDPEGVVRRPFNNFLQQATTIDQYGRPFYAVPDVAVGPSASSQMVGDSLVLTFSYCNSGDNILNAPYPITVFANAYGGDTICSVTMNGNLPVDSCTQGEIRLPVSVLCGFPNLDSLVVAVNGNNVGIAQNGGLQPECDTTNNTVTLPVTIHTDTVHLTATACDSYLWYGDTLTQSGEYTHTITNAVGCDSVVTLHLTVNHSVTELVEATACESYAWNDSVYTASGDYSRTFTAANGCDSVVTLHLTVNQTSGSLISASVVENSLPCMLNGSSYMEPGTYYQHFTNAAGCDSTVTLQLTVYYNQTVAVDSTVCGDALPVVWNDSVFTASGTKTRVYPAANGADSIVVMTLHVNSSPVAAISGLTALCADSMVTLTADSAYSYLWSTGDTTQAISVTEEGFYTLTVTNEYGCEAVTIHQLSSLGNPILSVTLPDMCAGDSYTFSVGHQGSDNIHLGRGETTLSLTDTVFLPDGVYCEPRGCSYHSPLTFTAYAPGSTIQSADDIHYVRLNMEHSYIGDLYINITCPNGQKADLLKYGGSGSSECNDQIPTSSRGWAEGDNMPGYTFLGNAYDYNVSTCDPSAFGNEPGEGWNYCWSDNTTQGYTYSTGAGGYIYRFVNTPSTGAGSIVDSSDVAAGTQFYHPDDPFSNLIGCPLNGPWYIEVQDGWNSDNGYIFGWELALSSEMLPDISFELAYTTADGPWITVLSDSLFQIDPPANLGNDTTVVYTFTVYDTTGCAYDTTVSVNFYAIRHTELDTVVCEGFVWNDSLHTTSGQYVRHFVSAAGCDSVSALNLTVNSPTDTTIHIVVWENALPYQYNEISYVEAGTYTQYLTNAVGCDSILTVLIDVIENVSVSLDSTVCESALPLTWNDSVFTAAGTKATTILAANGADSTITMLLTVIPTVTELVEVTACESYNWNGTNYTESGDYPQTFTAAGGCDSIVTLHLTVHHGTHNATTETACDSYEWHDSAYTASGVYTYEYTNADGCPSADTLHLVVIPLPELTLSPDTTIIFGTSLSLWASGADYYQWLPTDGLSNPNSATPLASPLQPTCYQVTGYAAPAEQDNMVVNGGFEAGYTGFTTDYNYVANPSHHNLGFGNFVINEDAHNVWPQQHQYGYGGDGLFMIVDGASTPNATVWSQTVNVQPNTSYDFSAQIVSLCASDISVARLQFVVNGVQLGPIFEAPSTLYQWVKFHDFWNSGNDTVATITILNQNTNGQGNDFGLDDIVFAPMPECFVTDSVCVSVIYNVVDTMTICESELPYEWNGVTFTQAGTQTATLAAATGADSVVTMTLTVIPTTYGTFDTAVIENALPLQYNEISYFEAGTYTQYLTNAAGCDSILTLTLTVFPNVTTELDSTVCESDLPVTWNGVSFTAAGTDSVTLQAATGADSTVVMTLHVVALPVITHSADTVIMPGASVNLWATGADIMAWTDADGNPLSSGGNLTVAPTVTTTYYITAFNEGNSVVTNGDFESGNAGFTTAYQYNSNLWPEGNYYVGTNAHNHHGNFPNWYDHTTGSGLYMIVNGATVAGTNLWTQTVPVIPHTSYAFSAWVCTLVGGYSSLARLQFSVNATQLGEIFHSPSSTSVWNRYYEVWYSGENTTATLTILNQNTTGGGNDFGVDDIQFSPLNFCNVTDSVTVYVSGQTDSTVCADALPLLWNGVEFTAAGTQTATITTPDGSDSVVVMTLHVNALSYNNFDTAVVESTLPLQYNGISYIEAGTYTQHLTNAAGCDSILTVNVTVFPNVTSELDSAVCETAFPFTWNDSVFTAAGTKTTTILAHTGADSTITMTVTMLPTTYGSFDTVIVENALPCQYNEIPYIEAGTYTQYLTNAAGCDSVLTVLIDVIENVSVSVDSTVCEAALPLTWNDSVFTAAGTKTTTILAHTGADSTITMTLTVIPTTYSIFDTAVIENALPLQYNEISYIEAGTYTQNFTNTLGCDSILTIHLTVYQNVTSTVDTTVCAADLPYTWHGHNFTAAGTHMVTLFTSHGADSVVTYHLSVDNIAANIGNITHITCYGESTGSATASVTGGQTPMTYAWTNASGTNIATTTSISNRPAGAYTFTVTDHIGCTATASVTLNTLNGELQPGTIAASQEVCDGEDIAPFTGTAASGGNNGAYQWQISTNGTDWTPAPGTNNAQTYTYPNSATNSFSLRRSWVSQSCGTVYSNIVTVSVWPNSIDTITASVCQGEIYNEYNFDISTDQTAVTGEYTYEQHHATGHCDSAVILLLTVNPVVAELVEATLCEGEGYCENGFTISPQETIGESVLTRVQNLQTTNGCDSVVTLQLTVIDTALRIEMLTEDFCEYNEAALAVLSPMQDYVWSTGETATTIVVTSPGIYSVTASEGGCSATAHIRVEGCHYELVLPNAITPSRGDGLNDCFYIPEGFIPNINLFKVYIYNRWGELVFYSTDKNFRWYGEYRGQTQYQTIYNYVIEYTDTAGRPQRLVGSITVL